METKAKEKAELLKAKKEWETKMANLEDADMEWFTKQNLIANCTIKIANINKKLEYLSSGEPSHGVLFSGEETVNTGVGEFE